MPKFCSRYAVRVSIVRLPHADTPQRETLLEFNAAQAATLPSLGVTCMHGAWSLGRGVHACHVYPLCLFIHLAASSLHLPRPRPRSGDHAPDGRLLAWSDAGA